MNPADRVAYKLKDALAADLVEVEDDSWKHAGHAGMAGNQSMGGTHLRILVVSPQFETLNLLARHRLVHRTLKEEMEQFIHALELKLHTPQEWQAANG